VKGGALEEREIRVGIIGAGFISQVAHLHSFSRVSGTRIVALSEPHEVLRHSVARRFGIDSCMADYRLLLDRSDVDAVVVCVPRRAQSLVVADALARVPAVLSEKPMAMTLDEAKEIVSIAKISKKVLAVGYMKRYDLGVRSFAKLLRELRNDNRFGEILQVSVRDLSAAYGVPVPDHIRKDGSRPLRYREAIAAPDFVTDDWKADYEYTLNVASHDIDLLQMLFDETLVAKSFSVRSGGSQNALLDAGAFPISLLVAPADFGRWEQQIEVTFARGRASLILPSPLARQESATAVIESSGRIERMNVLPGEQIWAFEAQARSFVESVRSGTELECSGANALADIALIDSLWRRADVRR
jgi:predicted dehydrogenase